jgi:hypothetical protein
MSDSQSSSTAAAKPCMVCREAVKEDVAFTFPYPCSHTYCTSCLILLCRTSFGSGWLFPPRCCQIQLPYADPLVVRLLGDDLARELQVRAIEHADIDKTYCFNPRCSAYLPRPSDESQATDLHCDACGTRTCRRCKLASHENECIIDQAIEQTKALAKARGWRQCFRCKTMVEKTNGCDHMT